MAIALFSAPNLFTSLHALLGWLAPPRSLRASRPARRVARPLATAPSRSGNGLAVRADASEAAKPLRVVRVFDPSAPRAGAGRMVISGRMADVCAELDRLAALEAC